jgi:hypothetical protein
MHGTIAALCEDFAPMHCTIAALCEDSVILFSPKLLSFENLYFCHQSTTPTLKIHTSMRQIALVRIKLISS